MLYVTIYKKSVTLGCLTGWLILKKGRFISSCGGYVSVPSGSRRSRVPAEFDAQQAAVRKAQQASAEARQQDRVGDLIENPIKWVD